MQSARERNRGIVVGASVLIVLGLILATARPVRPAPKNPKSPTPTPAPPTPTPPPTSTPAPTRTPSAPPDGLAVDVESPADGGAIPWSVTDVTGVVAGPGPLGVIVNGVTAVVGIDRDGRRRFFVDDLALAPGENVITASVVTREGAEATRSLTVTASPTTPPVRLRAAPVAGEPPLAVELAIEIDEGVSFQHPTLDTDLDGTIDVTVSEPTIVSHLYPIAGLHRARLVSRSAGRTIVDEVAIRIEAAEGLVGELQILWERFRAALRAGDVDAALALVAASSREGVAAQISGMRDLGIDPDLVLHPVEPGLVYPGMAELSMPRLEPDGETISYPVLFVRDGDGIWRIRGF